MHAISTVLPQFAYDHSRVLNANRTLPGTASDKASSPANTQQPKTEKPAAEASSAASGKDIPAGLQAALARFKAMSPEDMTRGQTQAQSSIERNIARYLANQPAETSTIVTNNPAAESVSTATDTATTVSTTV